MMSKPPKFFLYLNCLNERWTSVIVAGLFIVLAYICPSCPNSVEDLTQRASLFVGGSKKPAPEIVIATVDKRTLEEMGNWPWSTQSFMQFTKGLKDMGAKVIIFEGNILEEAGPSLLQAIQPQQAAIDTIVGYNLYQTLGAIPTSGPPQPDEKENDRQMESLVFPSVPEDDSTLISVAGISPMALATAERKSVREGFSNAFADPDGTVRSQPLAVRLRHHVLPSMVLVGAGLWKGFTPIPTQDANGQMTGLSLGDDRIFTKPDAKLQINYTGEEGTFPYLGIADIVAGRIPRESIAHRIILVGIVEPGINPWFSTPVGRMPPIEVAANVLDNIIRGRPLVSWADRNFVSFFLIAVCAIFAFLVAPRRAVNKLMLTGVILAALWATAIALRQLSNILFPASYISLMIIVTATILEVQDLFGKTWPLHSLSAQLRGRISESTIKMLARSNQFLSNEVRTVEVTALALDIKGFSAIANRLTPEEATSFINSYRSFVAGILTGSGAFIDSWSGDECRAVFGAPLELPDHALKATRAAFKLVRSLSSRPTDWTQKFGIERLRIGIGIYTGPVAVGEIGPEGGRTYGAVGVGIEAAGQLCAMNRIYRTSILVGEPTYKITEGTFQYRPLDPLPLCGDTRASAAYELVGEKGIIMPQLADYLRAREAYLSGEFDEAAHLFRELLSAHPHDGPSQVLLQKALKSTRTPPKED